jgi:hypothetical protein
MSDCNGQTVKFKLTGGGAGLVEGDCKFDKITLTGTTDKTVFTITPPPGQQTTIGSITTDGPIKSIQGKNVNLNGNISINGGTTSIVMNDVLDCNITIGSSSSLKATSSLKFGMIENLVLATGTPVRELRAKQWNSGWLDAPWITTMTITGEPNKGIAGNFGADVTLGSEGAPKNTALRTAKITGLLGSDLDTNNMYWNIDGNCGTIQSAAVGYYSIMEITGSVGTILAAGNRSMGIQSSMSGEWTLDSVKTIKADNITGCYLSATQTEPGKTPAIGNVSVKQWINYSTIESANDIGQITANGLDNSKFTAASMKNIMVKGMTGLGYYFINSNIESEYISNVYLTCPGYLNNGTPFMLKAGRIDKLTIKDPAGTKTMKNLDLPSQSFVINDFLVSLH